MTVSDEVVQHPEAGSRHLVYRGDVFSFRLDVPGEEKGTAWVRTNLGKGRVARREIIRQVEQNEAPLYQDWTDIPMKPAEGGGFELRVPLCENGHFEAKAYFLPDADGQPVWPPGENAEINVEPAETVCGNIIYNAFVRQFGPNKEGRRIPSDEHNLCSLDREGFAVIPPSGKFRDLIKELDFIVHELGCRFIQLLPVNPAPTIYGRMGRFGSPYAAQSFTAVDPAMAEFDHRATPLEQFMELVDAIHSRGSRIILDIAINHTGWGAAVHETHPQWLSREKDGRIQMPGAWGVTWEDLARLDYNQPDLWEYMAEVLLVWCRRGVDGFRCDAGYMIPVGAWRYLTARVREEFPDTVFFLEGLGGRISTTRAILDSAAFNWAYSELFQNYNREQICSYLPLADEISATDGIMVNFAETHDNDRLASISKRFAMMRTALCALLSRAGGFAFANGVEWFAEDKIDVHDATPLNWGAKENQVAHIRRLNRLLKNHPVFFRNNSQQQFAMAGEGNFIAVLRQDENHGKSIVVVVNLEHEHETKARWIGNPEPIEGVFFYDLLTEEHVNVSFSEGVCELNLAPGQVLCLSSDLSDSEFVESPEEKLAADSGPGMDQKLKAAALDVFEHYHGTSHLEDFDADRAGKELYRDPEEFCRAMNPESRESRVINWQWPGDQRREVMVPPGHFLLIRAPFYFRAGLVEDSRTVYTGYALASGSGYFLLIPPQPEPENHRQVVFKIKVFEKERIRHGSGSLLYLAPHDKVSARRALYRQELISGRFMFLETNGRGAMMRAATQPRRMRSRYDALLAANPDKKMPVDRWIMLARCRIWVVYQDYSQAVRTDCIQKFLFDYASHGHWLYKVPTGLGLHIMFSVGMEMLTGENRVRVHFCRHRANAPEQLKDDLPVSLIVRPDVENRSFHETTKAFTGPEYSWPQAVYRRDGGFSFRPDQEHILEVDFPEAGFVFEPEWKYMVHRPVEAERGLDPDSDLFSPGYFKAGLKGGQSLGLEASMEKPAVRHDSISALPEAFEQNEPESMDLDDAMQRAMKHYLVEREECISVIAGYPWFLDWGRDSLIFCRGLIAEGSYDKALSIIRLFSRFEKKGTLPNMIHGKDSGNRDTSDAPLWLIIACRDLAAAMGSSDFLGESMGERTLRQILFSIVSWYIKGTDNGIRMDPDTGLIFSPAHFTWMDTNFPAGTPRQGYPVEIQALWHAGLSFIKELDPPLDLVPEFDVEKIRAGVADAIENHYFDKKRGFLTDCLHCGPHTPPASASADDSLRPNQLFAITMDAVSDQSLCRSVLDACGELLVPGAIRSLADRPVDHPIEIRHNGELLGDPFHPYRGRYAGDEDTRRKPAYHNGTAWTWLFPLFCEAWVKVYGDAARYSALARLGSASRLINQGCLGHVPEILDGDVPHNQRGCDAQAWGASELYRVWKAISKG